MADSRACACGVSRESARLIRASDLLAGGLVRPSNWMVCVEGNSGHIIELACVACVVRKMDLN